MNEFRWTGNPFVDTGMAVIIARAKELKIDIKSISELTPEIIEKVCISKYYGSNEDFSWLSKMNQKLNSYTMVLTTNGPLRNPSCNKLLNLKNAEKKIEKKKKKTEIEIEKERLKLDELKKELFSEIHEGKKRKLLTQIEKKEKSILKKESAFNQSKSELSKKKEGHDKKVSELEIKIEFEKCELEDLGSKMITENSDSIKRRIENNIVQKRKSILKKEDALNRLKSNAGLGEYISIIKELIEDLKTQKLTSDAICEASGIYRATKVMENKGKRIGKEWFPLIGSLDDVQTLPSASRSARLSAISLIAAQLLPMGVAMQGGKLVCFQTNDYSISETPIFQQIVEEIYHQTMGKAEVNPGDAVETFGKDGGYNSISMLLLKCLDDLAQRKSLSELPDYTCLNLWRFSNSGDNPYLEIIEIPNKAVQFLWETWRGNLRLEIEKYLNLEKNAKSNLLQCIKDKDEYHLFYPAKKGDLDLPPASIELFDLYCEKILGYSRDALNIGKWMAAKILKEKTPAEIQRLKANHLKFAQIKDILVEFALDGLRLEDYLLLFPCVAGPVRIVKKKAEISANIIWFYLHHDIKDCMIADGGGTMPMHPKHLKIKTFAQEFFKHYIDNEGLTRFEKRIKPLLLQNQLKPQTIEDWFVSLAGINDGYSNEEWDDLSRDESGNNELWEVIFQLRLELINLYRNKCKSAEK
ncbi:MAG: hypothetical protein PHQ23_05305 [Candidatus Wallbacteria bacterium]|nr:hypothetical protein [Candidatus Wallbacteria bacterium]